MRVVFLLASLLYVVRADKRCFNAQGIAITDSSFVPCNSSATESACCVRIPWLRWAMIVMLILFRRQTKEMVTSASKEASAMRNKALTAATYTATAAPIAPSAIKVAHMRAPWRVSESQQLITHCPL